MFFLVNYSLSNALHRVNYTLHLRFEYIPILLYLCIYTTYISPVVYETKKPLAAYTRDIQNKCYTCSSF